MAERENVLSMVSLCYYVCFGTRIKLKITDYTIRIHPFYLCSNIIHFARQIEYYLLQ